MNAIVKHPFRNEKDYMFIPKRMKAVGRNPFSDYISLSKKSPVDTLKLQFPDLSEEVSIANSYFRLVFYF